MNPCTAEVCIKLGSKASVVVALQYVSEKGLPKASRSQEQNSV